MTLNAGKYHFICLGWDAANETFIFKNLVMTNTKNQKIVGVTTDNKLNCRRHIKQLCTKALQKIGALSIFSSYLNHLEKKISFQPYSEISV